MTIMSFCMMRRKNLNNKFLRKVARRDSTFRSKESLGFGVSMQALDSIKFNRSIPDQLF